ncbi:WS/DGAT domain-containing protein [Mycobacterium sp. LTG2003]
MRRLAAVDAQTWWMSAKLPSDQFLLYGFDGSPTDLGRALAEVRRRAEEGPELALRVRDGFRLTYPAWVQRRAGDDQFVVHDLGGPSWNDCLDAVAGLADHQLDATSATWRLHVFPGVRGVPGVAASGAVAVLQVAHVLGDGIRSSALAAWLFGRQEAVPAVPAERFVGATLPWRAASAARTHRQLVADEKSGAVPAQAPSRPARRSNSRPAGARWVRTIVRPRARIPGPTVTVAVLAAVSAALSDHLRTFGEDPAGLGAEVPMAKAGVRHAHNHFGNVGIGLYPELDHAERIAHIAHDLAQRRSRARHPAMAAASRAFAATPAPLLRWGVAQFDPTLRSPVVTGNTVVSSVNRGAADLRFGDAPVVVTAGYPALSPMMGLTHGVHGIGDTLAVSVHAAESAVGDVDAYVERLAQALG